mgnify:FL=1
MDQRETFVSVTTELLSTEPELRIVLADISADHFAAAARAHPTQVINVGIREQLQVGVAGGLALTGLRPIVHSYAPFLLERAYEQIKLDLDHQQVGAVLVSVGGSYDVAEAGRTHYSPGDVALVDTLGEWTVHTPGHPAEVAHVLHEAVQSEERIYIRLEARSNSNPHENLEVLQRGSSATIFAVGTTLDRVMEATKNLDVTVIYVRTPRPLNRTRLSELTTTTDIMVVEPYLRGTSSAAFTAALGKIPHRFAFLGVGPHDLHQNGSVVDHDRLHGLDVSGIRASILTFLSAE